MVPAKLTTFVATVCTIVQANPLAVFWANDPTNDLGNGSRTSYSGSNAAGSIAGETGISGLEPGEGVCAASADNEKTNPSHPRRCSGPPGFPLWARRFLQFRRIE